jgi:response regulator RpfG family c-di-GMP phosphodiesterase
MADSVVRRYLDRALSLRDARTTLHAHRVSFIARAIGVQMGCTPHEARALYLGGILHDIGKIGTPDAVLLKNGSFDDNDHATMRRHCEDGFAMLRGKVTNAAAMVALCHHEHCEGSRYLNGLIGDAIPMSARVCSVADYYDAATSDHGGRIRCSPDEAAAEIDARRGTFFDPVVVDAFLRARKLQAFDAPSARGT